MKIIILINKLNKNLIIPNFYKPIKIYFLDFKINKFPFNEEKNFFHKLLIGENYGVLQCNLNN